MQIVQALDHIAVTVSDLRRSLPFYTDMLGLQEAERHLLEGETISAMAGKAGVVMQVVRLKTPDGSRVLLDLQQYISPKGAVSNGQLGMSNHAHFCFQVKDLQQAYQLLKAKGVEFISAPVAFGHDDPIRVVFFKDPDGFILELVEVRPK
jgi:catechol 2,3-dioxygenase-like lactoylglutathione lyase family enzyme